MTQPTTHRTYPRTTPPAAPSQAAARKPTLTGGTRNTDWWPNALNLKMLHQHDSKSTPLDADFNYAEAFKTLDLDAVVADLHALMTDSQDWWPADWGHYGGLFVRMTWHAAGTYRIHDGRGGAGSGSQRFAPLNSWPDNGNLDKARRLLWPIKQKYGQKLSWADLLRAGRQRGHGHHGLQDLRFWRWPPRHLGTGRRHQLGRRESSGWPPATSPTAATAATATWPTRWRAVQMGLIYVNPQGPDGKPDPVASGRDVRETFARMAMNDEETVALVAGGHTFGKAHGAAPESHVGREPEGAGIEEQGFGWTNSFGSGKGAHAITSGIEGAWKPNPTTWDMGYFDMLFGYEWELSKSPAGAHQWHPMNCRPEDMIPDAHVPGMKHRPMMTTADMSLRMDPAYEKISRRYHANPAGVRRRLCTCLVQADAPRHGPACPLPGQAGAGRSADLARPRAGRRPPAGERRRTWPTLKAQVLASGLTVRSWSARPGPRPPPSAAATSAAAPTARASAWRRRTDWEVNQPAELAKVLTTLEDMQAKFNDAQTDGKKISLADLIVLAGDAAVEAAAKAGGVTRERCPSLRAAPTPRRTRPTSSPSPCWSRWPMASATTRAPGCEAAAAELLVDKAQLLTLSAPRDDGAGRRPAGAGRQRRPGGARCLHRSARAR